MDKMDSVDTMDEGGQSERGCARDAGRQDSPALKRYQIVRSFPWPEGQGFHRFNAGLPPEN